MHRLTRLSSVVILTSVSILNVSGQGTGPDAPIIDPEIYERLAAAGKVRVGIFLATPQFAPGELRDLIEEVSRAQGAVLQKLSARDFSLKRRYQTIPALVGEVTTSGVAKLVNLPGVLRVGPDVQVRGHLAEAVPLTNSDDVQALGFTGNGITVAIVDTGVDGDHPDLVDDLVAEVCFCGTSCCPNGTDNQAGAGAAQDDNGHGSHVAGIVTSGGRVAPVGVAPNARIVAIKVLDGNNRGDASDAIMALEWIIANRPDVTVVNMSLGTDALFTGDCDNETWFTMAYATAVSTLRGRGVATFASAGNNGSGSQMSAPACVSQVISVGAVWDSTASSDLFCLNPPVCTATCDDDPNTRADLVTCFSNSSTTTDVFAPGAPTRSDWLNGGTNTISGTSQASPVAAGCTADLFQVNPGLSPDQIEVALESTGPRVTDATNGLAFPRVDCLAALVSLGPQQCSRPLDVVPCDVLEFGEVPVGDYRDNCFRVANLGTAQCCVSVTGPGTSFELVSPREFCISPGVSTQACVRFNPPDSGARFSTLTFSSDVCNDETRTVKGTGVSYAATCSAPLPLACGSVVDGTNRGGELNIDRYYVNGVEHAGYFGPEQIHTLTIDSNDSVAISACLDDCNNSGGGMDLFVCETCQSHTISTCRRFQDPNGRLSLDDLASGTYYVVVDSYAGEGNLGDYRLQVDCCADRNGSTTCGTGACRRTVQNCLNGVPQACVPGVLTPEQCDGMDNDCDGSVDEGLSRMCSTVCGTGLEYCVIGTWRGCTAPQPQPEVCDGLDSDCDGAVPPGESDADVDGFMVCEGDCDDSDPRTYPGAPETNDARDNQCAGEPGYGLVDELSGPAGFMDSSDPNLFCWPAQAEATSYEVARADVPTFAAGCMKTIVSETCWADPSSPFAGSGFFYLVRAIAPNAGSWGQDSSGRERTQVCP